MKKKYRFRTVIFLALLFSFVEYKTNTALAQSVNIPGLIDASFDSGTSFGTVSNQNGCINAIEIQND